MLQTDEWLEKVWTSPALLYLHCKNQINSDFSPAHLSLSRLTSCCQMPRPSNTHLFVLGAPWLLPSSKHCFPVPFLTPFSCSFPSPPQRYQTNGHQRLCIEKITRKCRRISFSFTASWGSAGTSSNPSHCIDPTERFLYKVSDNRVFETTQPPGSIQLVCRLHSRLCPPRCAALIFFMGSDVNTHTHKELQNSWQCLFWLSAFTGWRVDEEQLLWDQFRPQATVAFPSDQWSHTVGGAVVTRYSAPPSSARFQTFW